MPKWLQVANASGGLRCTGLGGARNYTFEFVGSESMGFKFDTDSYVSGPMTITETGFVVDLDHNVGRRTMRVTENADGSFRMEGRRVYDPCVPANT